MFCAILGIEVVVLGIRIKLDQASIETQDIAPFIRAYRDNLGSICKEQNIKDLIYKFLNSLCFRIIWDEFHVKVRVIFSENLMSCIFHSTVRRSYGNRELVSFFMSKFDNLSQRTARACSRENRSPRTLRPPYITFQIISRQNDASTAS